MGGNLKEIRKQITSVKNTQKTTKAMKLVSSSKLKKAEELARRSKVYANQLNAMFDDVVKKIRLRGLDSINSRFFVKSKDREIKKLDIVFITADKGLCGGFNTTTIKEVVRLMESYKQKNIKVRLRGIGKKGISFFAFNDIEVLDKVVGLSAMPTFEKAAEFIDSVVEDFLNGATDEVIIVHNGFKNMISQELETRAILPLTINVEQDSQDSILNIEPEDEEDAILDELAKKYIQYNMYYALVDSLAAEHSARIQAMDAATNNAGDLVKSLTISLNKARQEAITTELVEINAGAEAIK
ncbi:F0F1 ATP synthase subunit gamma [Helicobacter cinaedi]|uniref:ATP synthase gamma chain n=1 Tax=Helicobacter cinaedi CCUG 18818 = ATCC BAA-847 TaxID=537971 RepID=A0AAI8QGD5_9HELI|nr:ATP synthase F1 subunit gamma [Helicobacter cinaedi]EFR47617.1 ATP synthase F1, gamma subunit [Helicobacter cinaedi CCUG 18818 = ATCC BAA-847]QOQ91433.1 F0F1 ATP synthase subunit gamma [Helicobacter cinaedi]BAM32546.1 F0F1 ATP synthase subunit gamma [Helicobacter cinaedi CCUG 18818 = ATCC BAA-847]